MQPDSDMPQDKECAFTFLNARPEELADRDDPQPDCSWITFPFSCCNSENCFLVFSQ
jgi:hypothetical protein